MATRRLHQKITQQDFDNVKRMLKAGFMHKEIRDTLSVGMGTISIINRTNDLDDYQKIRNSYRNPQSNTKQSEQISEDGTTSTAQPTEQPVTIPVDQLRLITTELQEIKFAIIDLIKALEESRQSKKGIFKR